MLWYLHLCSVHKIIVTEYLDNATGYYGRNLKWKIYKSALNPKLKITDKNMIKKSERITRRGEQNVFYR